MRWVIVVSLLCVLPSVVQVSASEYPRDNPYPTKNEMQLRDLVLAEKIVALRESSSESWLNLITLVFGVGTLVFIIVGFFSHRNIENIKSDAQKHAQAAEKCVQDAQASLQQIKDLEDFARVIFKRMETASAPIPQEGYTPEFEAKQE